MRCYTMRDTAQAFKRHYARESRIVKKGWFKKYERKTLVQTLVHAQIEFNNPILALDAVAWKWEVPSYSVRPHLATSACQDLALHLGQSLVGASAILYCHCVLAY